MHRGVLALLGGLVLAGSLVARFNARASIHANWYADGNAWAEAQAEVALVGVWLGGLALLAAAAFRPTNRASPVWARLFLALAAGAALGFGAGFLSLGLLPEFPPDGPPRVPERVFQDGHSYMVFAPVGDEPVDRAEKRRFATVFGIGFSVGSAGMVAIFWASRRWFEASVGRAAEPLYGLVRLNKNNES